MYILHISKNISQKGGVGRDLRSSSIPSLLFGKIKMVNLDFFQQQFFDVGDVDCNYKILGLTQLSTVASGCRQKVIPSF